MFNWKSLKVQSAEFSKWAKSRFKSMIGHTIIYRLHRHGWHKASWIDRLVKGIHGRAETGSQRRSRPPRLQCFFSIRTHRLHRITSTRKSISSNQKAQLMEIKIKVSSSNVPKDANEIGKVVATRIWVKALHLSLASTNEHNFLLP
jgi:hypothetical protein